MLKRLCYLFVYLIGCTSVIILGYCLVLHHIEGDNKVQSQQQQLTTSTHPIEKPRHGALFGQNAAIDPLLAAIHPTNILLEKYNEYDVKTRLLREKIQRLTAHTYMGTHEDEAEELQRRRRRPLQQGDDVADDAVAANDVHTESTRHVHVFYSAPVNWYRSASNNSGTHLREPDGIGTESNQLLQLQTLNTVFYPMLGLYTISTRILEHHCRNIQAIGVNVMVVGWQPEKSLEMLRHLLNFAHQYHAGQLHVAIEVEPFAGRTARSVRDIFEMFHREFVWSHPALYRVWVQSKRTHLPMVYVRDACDVPDVDWASVLTVKGGDTIRGTSWDAVLVGHVSTKKDTGIARRGGFNGFYTRLASNGATYGSTWKNWDLLKRTADKYGLIFIPTVGPGFNERKKEPPSGGWRRHRSNGQYFGVAWRTAMSVGAQFVSIASYNDWPAGTQIEECIPYAGYKDYQPTGPRKYLDLTRHWVQEYIKSKTGGGAVAAHTNVCNEFFNNTIC